MHNTVFQILYCWHQSEAGSAHNKLPHAIVAHWLRRAAESKDKGFYPSCVGRFPRGNRKWRCQCVDIWRVSEIHRWTKLLWSPPLCRASSLRFNFGALNPRNLKSNCFLFPQNSWLMSEHFQCHLFFFQYLFIFFSPKWSVTTSVRHCFNSCLRYSTSVCGIK